MTNEERAKLNAAILNDLAEQVNAVRLELLSFRVLYGDTQVSVDDSLSSITSAIKDISETIECYG